MYATYLAAKSYRDDAGAMPRSAGTVAAARAGVCKRAKGAATVASRWQRLQAGAAATTVLPAPVSV